MRKKVLIVCGTRPEAIKVLPVYKYLIEHYNSKLKTFLCSTGQHKEMLQSVFDVFEVHSDIDLKLMKNNQGLSDLTSNILVSIDELLKEIKPDLILVQGDTTTAFASALAGFYNNIPIAHLEAGLRTYDLSAPFPEEANRKLITSVANMHFAPTQLNKESLINEGVQESSICVTGNTVLDSLLYVDKKSKEDDVLGEKIKKDLELEGYKISNRKFILITSHRRESFGQGFINICAALKKLSRELPDYDLVFPVHLNPNVQNIIHSSLNNISNVYLMKPVGYQSFVSLMSRSEFILTDSGGVQEEAPSLGKPVFVMREKTERKEGVLAKLVKIVGTTEEGITRGVLNSVNNNFSDFSFVNNPYGDGNASQKVSEKIIGFLKR